MVDRVEKVLRKEQSKTTRQTGEIISRAILEAANAVVETIKEAGEKSEEGSRGG